MNKSIIPTLQKTFGDRAISHEDKRAFEQEHGCEWQEDWSEYDEGEDCDHFTNGTRRISPVESAQSYGAVLFKASEG